MKHEKLAQDGYPNTKNRPIYPFYAHISKKKILSHFKKYSRVNTLP